MNRNTVNLKTIVATKTLTAENNESTLQDWFRKLRSSKRLLAKSQIWNGVQLKCYWQISNKSFRVKVFKLKVRSVAW